MAITLTAAAAAALGKRVNPDAYATVAVVAPSTAGFLLTLFFGAMGASARLSELFKAGPALLSFAVLALVAHSIFIVGVSSSHYLYYLSGGLRVCFTCCYGSDAHIQEAYNIALVLIARNSEHCLSITARHTGIA
jgi:hypothetical protein